MQGALAVFAWGALHLTFECAAEGAVRLVPQRLADAGHTAARSVQGLYRQVHAPAGHVLLRGHPDLLLEAQGKRRTGLIGNTGHVTQGPTPRRFGMHLRKYRCQPWVDRKSV